MSREEYLQLTFNQKQNRSRSNLAKYAKKIKRRANGRKCGSCEHFVRGMCVFHDLDIVGEDAVACRQHAQKVTN